MKVVELTKQRDVYKKQSIAGYKLRTDLEFWRDMPAQEMRIRCGEISTQEMRTVRAVLSTILSANAHREQRLVLGSSGAGVQEPEQEKCGATHYAGCACHERGWENKWKAAIEMAARAEHERIERLESMLGKWLEWARMHGHLEHAAGIADDSRRLISPENAESIRAANNL